MVVRMRVNRSKTGKRRSHHALSATRLAICECGAPRRSHRACAECGKYDGKIVIDVVARAKRQARRAKKHQKELRAAGQEKDSTNKEEAKTTT